MRARGPMAIGKQPTDHTGRRFGRLVAMAIEPRVEGAQHRRWTCLCDCGALTSVSSSHLVRLKVRSCGCLGNTTHGHTRGYRGSPEYHSWKAAWSRCTNPGNPSFVYYGERGITMCDRWRGEHGFENFLADMGPRPSGMSLDRIDNDRGYEPGNCRWATAKEQRHNRRDSKQNTGRIP